MHENNTIPKDLQNEIDARIAEGNEIFITDNGENVTWIVVHADIKWYSIYQWYVGSDEWNVINIHDKTINRLEQTMNEFGF